MRQPIEDRQADLLPVLIAPALELAVNHVLRFAPATRQELAALSGKIVTLDITAPRLSLTLCLQGDHCDVKSYSEDPADATVRGPLFSLLRHLGFATTAGQLMASPVSIQGDTQLVQHLASVVASQDYDIEEPLSRVLGDVAAHTLGQGLKAFGRWLGTASHQVAQAGGRMLASEGQLSVTQPEFRRFSQGVETLRDDLDRLEARLQRLNKQLPPAPTT